MNETSQEKGLHMDEVMEFIKKSEGYFIATAEDDQPRVRPFGSMNKYDNKFYIQTGKSKDVSKQIAGNPKVEICAKSGAEWVRVKAVLVEDESIKAQQSMIDAIPALQATYKAGDGNCQVFYLKDATATFFSRSAPSRTLTF